MFLWNPDPRFLKSTGYVSGQIDPLSLYTPSYFLLLGLSWIVYVIGRTVMVRRGL